MMRVQYLAGDRWLTIGLDCFDMSEVRATAAMAPRGARVRAIVLEG